MTAPLVYEVFDGSVLPTTSKGALAANVVDEPTFVCQIGGTGTVGGPGTLRLSLDRAVSAVSNLSDFDLVQVTHPDGTVMGRWKYEQMDGDETHSDAQTLTLVPICAELHDVDFGGNYQATGTPNDSDGQAPVGVQKFSRWVTDALAKTRNCVAAEILDDGVTTYAYDFLKTTKVQDTLDTAVMYGGGSWWWYCDGLGNVILAGAPRNVIAVNYTNHVEYAKPTRDLQNIWNVLYISGTGPSGNVIYPTVSGTTVNPYVHNGSPYGADHIGRRVAPATVVTGAKTVASLNSLAASMMARMQLPTVRWVLRMAADDGIPRAGRAQPGDQINLTLPDSSVVSNLWVTHTQEYGSTGVMEWTCESAIGNVLSVPHFIPSNTVPGGSSITNNDTVGAGGCGGLALLLRVQGTATGTDLSARTVLGSSPFTIDSPAGCSILVTGTVNLNALASGGNTNVGCFVAAGTDTSGTTDVCTSEESWLDAGPSPPPYATTTLLAPSGTAVSPATYVVYAALPNTSGVGAWTASFDLQVYLT